MIEIEHQSEPLSAPAVLTALFNEFSAVTDYRTLRDSLPRRLAILFKCRCVLLYQRNGETLQFASGSFDDKPGWSTALLTIAHINPLSLNSELPEACAWRERRAIADPAIHPTLIALPLLYRHRAIGVLVALRGEDQERPHHPTFWQPEELPVLEAIGGVVALLLENTRLLERDRERIHELSLLNSISSQMNCSMYELDRMRAIVIQRAREISGAELCEQLDPLLPTEHSSWITPMLHDLLFQSFREQRSPSPLIIERPGDGSNPDAQRYLNELPAHIKTFFAFPLLSGRAIGRRGNTLLRNAITYDHEPKVLGVVVGAYYRVWKMRREEVVLLQVLSSQASAVVENMHLMAQVVEARNEARKLLRQVLDDQRLKELILESIPSGLITTDRSGCITTFNRAAEAILGYRPYEVQGQPLQHVLHLQLSPETGQQPYPRPSLALASAPLPNAIHNVIQTGQAQSSTVLTEDRHGHELVLDVEILPLHDDLGEQIGTLATFTDVTSVHHLEEEKRRLDRLASLGEMAANVAHEVRNPLASIKTSIQMLMDDLAEEMPLSHEAEKNRTDWALESVSVVLKEVERLDAIVRDLLLFAKPRQLHRVSCNLVALNERILSLIQVQCNEANVVVHHVYEDIPPLWIDMAQMEQILFNLYMNAIQAMPDGGILTISCRRLSSQQATAGKEERALAVSPSLVSRTHQYSLHTRKQFATQPWVEIVVSDTGIGIPPNQLERIFQPFFTTKAHGIGLGLAITRRLVEDHGGYIQVEGHFGYGTTLIIRLPLHHDPALSTSDDEHEHVEDET